MNGYDALAIGKELPNQKIDQYLELWLKSFYEKDNN